MKTSIKKLLEKFKTINWKSKKSIIAYAIILAVLVGGTGTGLAINYFNNSSDIVKTDVDIKDKNTSKPADDKKDTDKKDENSKPTENKEEDKKDTNETSKTDNKEEDKKTNTQVNNTNNSNNSNSNNNTSNSGNTSTPPTNNGGGNSGNNSTPTPQPPAHTHNWVEVYETINHPEQGHNEQVPIYETKAIEVCKDCKKDVTQIKDLPGHIYDHVINGGKGGTYTDYIQEIVGYDTVWVVYVPAWPEQVLKGYACSCGATK